MDPSGLVAYGHSKVPGYSWTAILTPLSDVIARVFRLRGSLGAVMTCSAVRISV
ncbi:uncharacterized protein BDZ99DRAFT_464717 [Mytilinidion resinicola]|uniref:Uncharacterized protein n=1 Tax=Mytilinidion resinicola TaxID=574789 RepID=A0A6A6YIQ6_9PEZI|nr:uncharacterized protein BDZ99DRAFT_464717 [Mytilinidion resinicola]KAF2807807.1 hypothetical protein BDZ99DRAFT_464717 [Mytilinidion resinicola]